MHEYIFLSFVKNVTLEFNLFMFQSYSAFLYFKFIILPHKKEGSTCILFKFCPSVLLSNKISAAVAQGVRAFIPQAEDWVFES